MSDIIIASASLALGILATIVVSRYYFTRSLRKSLGAMVISVQPWNPERDSVPASVVAASARASRRELSEVQILVQNNGHRAIRELIEPLRFRVVSRREIYAAAVVVCKPKAVNAVVELGSDHGEAQCRFSILNPRDAFVVRLLVAGNVREGELSVTLAGDDLPYAVYPRWLVRQGRAGCGAIPTGALLLLFSAAFGNAAYAVWKLKFSVQLEIFQYFARDFASASTLALVLITSSALMSVGGYSFISGFVAVLTGERTINKWTEMAARERTTAYVTRDVNATVGGGAA